MSAGNGSIFSPSIADHGVAVVHQMMRQREAGGAEPDHQHLAPGRGHRQRPADIERVPARQQRIDLEAPGQRQHVLEHAGLDLRNVDRLLLLIDAGLHAVVADAMAGRRRTSDCRRSRSRARRWCGPRSSADASRRSSRRADSRRATTPNGDLLELAGLFPQPLRAAVLALVVAPDAVVGVVERAGEIGARVGQREAVAMARRCASRQLEHASRHRPLSVSTGTRCSGSTLCGTLNSTPPLWARWPSGVCVAQAA